MRSFFAVLFCLVLSLPSLAEERGFREAGCKEDGVETQDLSLPMCANNQAGVGEEGNMCGDLPCSKIKTMGKSIADQIIGGSENAPPGEQKETK